jgi:hypothetical protein
MGGLQAGLAGFCLLPGSKGGDHVDLGIYAEDLCDAPDRFGLAPCAALFNALQSSEGDADHLCDLPAPEAQAQPHQLCG